MDAELLVQSRSEYGITLVGPTRPNNNWQGKVEGAYTVNDFVVDWEKQQVICPQGKVAPYWAERIDRHGKPFITVDFRTRDCHPCPARALCTRKKIGTRRVRLPSREQYEAVHQARTHHASEEGRLIYKRSAGIEGTFSQAVRAFDLRQTRYRSLAKTRLQHIATAAAVNLERLVAWFQNLPRATTRTSRFAALALA